MVAPTSDFIWNQSCDVDMQGIRGLAKAIGPQVSSPDLYTARDLGMRLGGKL